MNTAFNLVCSLSFPVVILHVCLLSSFAVTFETISYLFALRRMSDRARHYIDRIEITLVINDKTASNFALSAYAESYFRVIIIG